MQERGVVLHRWGSARATPALGESGMPERIGKASLSNYRASTNPTRRFIAFTLPRPLVYGRFQAHVLPLFFPWYPRRNGHVLIFAVNSNVHPQ